MDPVWLIRLLTQMAFVVIFVVVVAEAVRRPYRASVDVALFFGAVAVAATLDVAADTDLLERTPLLGSSISALVMTFPYLLLRIVSDFSDVSGWLLRVAELGLVLAVAAMFGFREVPLPVFLVLVAYFVGFHLYGAGRFVGKARVSAGVTKRRMRAAALGSVFLGGALLLAGLAAALPVYEAGVDVLVRLSAVSAGLAYLVGLAPPGVLRRAWQEPELRAFLAGASSVPWSPRLAEAVRVLEDRTAAALGAERAVVALWDADRRVLRAPSFEGDPRYVDWREGEFIAGRVFARQEAVLAPDAAAEDPLNADVYEQWGARSVLAAPITVGGRKLGVLAVYTARAPVFARDDLERIQLLAEQVGVALESRRLVQEAATTRAREETTKLKDDFLSAAAHDLNTPLTALIARAQLLERRAEAHPSEPVDLAGIRRLTREAERLRGLVAKLLDVAGGEEASLLGEREPVDLAVLAREVCTRRGTDYHPCTVEVEGGAQVIAEVDRARVRQLIEYLVENAVKFSPEGGEVGIRVWHEGDEARFSVTDQGIGIPPGELPYVFGRFRRSAELNDRRFAGMGLGLYISRRITEQHGGRIWMESRVGEGSTVHVALPRPRGRTD